MKYEAEVIKTYDCFGTIVERENDIKKGIVDVIIPSKENKHTFVGIKIK